MKKFLSVITFVILLLPFAGCGAADNNTDNAEKKETKPPAAEKKPDITGSWLQMESDDPILLTLNSDGTMQYYATLSHESDYSGTYDWKESVLSMNLVNLDNSGTTSVPYLVDYTDNEDGTAFTLAIDAKNNTESTDALYGMEKILEGSYKRLSLSDEQLTDIEAQLGVPEDIETSVKQAPPQYWSSGQCWIVTVNIYGTDNTVIASAGVDPLTNELCRDILQYSGN